MVPEAQGKFDSRANSRSKIKLPHVIRVQSLFIKKKSRKSSDDKLKHKRWYSVLNYLGIYMSLSICFCIFEKKIMFFLSFNNLKSRIFFSCVMEENKIYIKMMNNR